MVRLRFNDCGCSFVSDEGDADMWIPAIKGVIERRILANFRVDAQCMASVLPPPFEPKLYGGYAIGGICLIRLNRIRPSFLPFPWGIGSENGAHRIAVQWKAAGKLHQGVYIPRRDTSSALNAMAGGRVFPGEHHRATFDVRESGDHYRVAMASHDSRSNVLVEGRVTSQLPASSIFTTLDDASSFFEAGSLGYSKTRSAGKFDGLELSCSNWSVVPLEIEAVESNWFQDTSRFPEGSVEFDCALLMRDIDHQWLGRPNLCCAAES